eukprot:m51a1_g14598 hypothetical protein (133) ;mRNA; f:1173317-1174077
MPEGTPQASRRVEARAGEQFEADPIPPEDERRIFANPTDPYAKGRFDWKEADVFCSMCVALDKSYHDIAVGTLMARKGPRRREAGPVEISLGTIVTTSSPDIKYACVMDIMYYGHARKVRSTTPGLGGLEGL